MIRNQLPISSYVVSLRMRRLELPGWTGHRPLTDSCAGGISRRSQIICMLAEDRDLSLSVEWSESGELMHEIHFIGVP